MDANLRQALVEILERHDAIAAAWVFGSVASGRARPDSDLDVAVVGIAALPPELRIRIATQLASVAGREVDLVDLFDVHGTLLEQVLTRGERLFCRRLDLYENLAKRLVYDEADFMPLYRRLLRGRRMQFLHE